MSKIVKKADLEGKLNLATQISMNAGSGVNLPTMDTRVIRRDVYEVSSEAKKVIEEARAESAVIKKQAQHILSRVEEERDKAKKEGFEAGHEEGLAEVTDLLVRAGVEKERMFADVEKQVVRLVYDIAEKVIGSELSNRDTAIVDLIRQALHASIGQNIVVLVNPQDLEIVRKNQPLLLQAIEVSKTVTVRGDEKVTPKGCIIETEIGTIDAKLETQLEAIRKALELEE